MTHFNVVRLRPEDLLCSPLFEEALQAAADHAEDVDKHARFPKEAVAALKGERALSVGFCLRAVIFDSSSWRTPLLSYPGDVRRLG